MGVISPGWRRALFAAAAVALGVLLSFSSVMALGRVRVSEMQVTTTADVIDAKGGDCTLLQPADLPGPDSKVSLREAICAANNAPGEGVISLPSGVYTLTIDGRDEDSSASGDLDITDDLTITGARSSETIVDGDAADRVLHVDPAGMGTVRLHLEGITIRNGAPGAAPGGGVYNRGRLVLANSHVCSNTVDASDPGAFGGGGLFNEGVLRLADSEICGNTVVGGAGGGLETTGAATLDGVTISSNAALAGGDGDIVGGGIANWGAITLTSCAVLGNSAADAGGGLYTGNELSAAVVIVTGTAFEGNAAGSGGGAIEGASSLHVRSSMIVSNTSGSGGGGVRLYPTVGDDISAAFTDTIIVDNTAGDRGGGILVRAVQRSSVNLSLVASTLEGNLTSSSGGGMDIYLTYGGRADVTMRACTMSSNTASTSDGGGLSVAAAGGGEAAVGLEGVTISSNSTGWSGGGVYAWASPSSTATVTVTNSTVSGNRADANGGGIYGSGSAVRVFHGTVTRNWADDDADDRGDGGGIKASGESVALTGTLVALNDDGSSSASVVHPDLYGDVTGDAYNLIGVRSYTQCNAGTGTDLVDPSPGLTALAKRGGETETHGLVPGSPAVDGVLGAACVVSTDQRGQVRPWDGDRDGVEACDIGAFELYPQWVFLPLAAVHPSP
jgi:hypothetical protein